MKPYMEKLTAYLESEEAWQGSGEDLLVGIYRNCFECEALNAEGMNEKYRQIYERTRHLPVRVEEGILDAVNDGFRMGLRLVLEGGPGRRSVRWWKKSVIVRKNGESGWNQAKMIHRK